MLKISTILDAAKENHDLTSDRQLARALGLTSVGTYRTKGVIPDDETAKKLSDLSGFKYEAVLASCHGATAKKNNDPEAVKAWRNIFRMAQSMAFVLVIFVTSLCSFGQDSNAEGLTQNQQQEQMTSNIESSSNIYYATLVIAAFFNGLCNFLKVYMA